jgi:nicotinamide-nucleotide amidase
MNQVKAAIITIGDELLIGQVIDTNSAYIAQQLNSIGIIVTQRIAVGDDKTAIWKALDETAINNQIILLTGGLGPTADDITKPLLCDYFGGKMILHQETLEHIKYLFKEVFKRPMIERNVKQAEVPDVCTVLKNEKGTAPGMLFKKNNTLFFAMPGVPHEMKWLMQEHVLPITSTTFTTGHILHKTLLTAGIGESYLAEMIKDWESTLPSFLKLAYLPNFGMVRLRISGYHDDKKVLEETINKEFEQVKLLVKDYLVTDEDEPLEKVVMNLLKKIGKTMSTAESCTGGAIAAALTAHAGASNVYKGSIISYANELKENILQVPTTTLKNVGAVSEQTVTQMAATALVLTNTDYSIAVSGIMGPNGGTPEKPVGLVWIATASKNKVIANAFNFRFDRARNIQLTVVNAYNQLRKLILEENQNS